MTNMTRYTSVRISADVIFRDLEAEAVPAVTAIRGRVRRRQAAWPRLRRHATILSLSTGFLEFSHVRPLEMAHD